MRSDIGRTREGTQLAPGCHVVFALAVHYYEESRAPHCHDLLVTREEHTPCLVLERNIQKNQTQSRNEDSSPMPSPDHSNLSSSFQGQFCQHDVHMLCVARSIEWKQPIFKTGSLEYTEIVREIVLWLFTQPGRDKDWDSPPILVRRRLTESCSEIH